MIVRSDLFCVFFFKQKTAYEMRISDWSSDVCSSDLAADSRIKVNPLASWDTAALARAFVERDLPRHPLGARGYPSVGCAPCTTKGDGAAGSRAGRWAGSDKIECDIHRTAHSPLGGSKGLR